MKLLNHKKYSIYNAFPSISNWICDGLKKRTQLIQWAQEKEERFIIEDDYDSEFRYFGKPIPAIQGLYSRGEKVIYISTFSKSIFPSCRVAYMVLPYSIMKNIILKITLKATLYLFICKTLLQRLYLPVVLKGI